MIEIDDVYKRVQELNISYSNIINDRIYYMEGGTLYLNPIYNDVQCVLDHLSINPNDVEVCRLEEIIKEKLR